MKYLLITLFIFFYSFANAKENFTPCPAKHITDLCKGKDNSLWAAGENSGIFQFTDGKWHEFRTGTPGFPATNNFTTICSDLEGRIWAGTMDRGITIYNGKEWKNYGILTGPLSCRIYDIQCSPRSGIVAIAHANGVTLWFPKTDKWQEITSFNGLPRSPVRSVCFTSDDSLYLAMECGGIVYCSAESRYQKNIVYQTKWIHDQKNRSRYPLSGSGKGLPCNWLNVVFQSSKGTIYCGSVGGIGISRKQGEFSFIRGQEYKEKIKGLYYYTNKDPKLPKEEKTPLLPEDYITAIGEFDGKLLLGFRNKGAYWMPENNWKKLQSLQEETWITSFCSIDNQLFAGTYGKGVLLLTQKSSNNKKQPKITSQNNIPNLPSEANLNPPSLPKLLSKIESMQRNKTMHSKRPLCVYIKDDWETRGNWCERQGALFGFLAAANAPISHLYYCFSPKDTPEIFSNVKGSIGPHHAKNGDTIRSWVHWVRANENFHDVLWAPCSGIRIEAEWDDHGEVYARTMDGPDIWVKVHIPKGIHYLSFYFFNPNGRDKVNGERDYLIEGYLHDTNDLYDEIKFDNLLNTEPLVRSRVSLFTGGVYKVFAVEGERIYAFRIVRNHSFNTILNGIFVSSVITPDYSELERKSITIRHYNFFPKKPSIAKIDIESLTPETIKLWGKSLEPQFLPYQQLIQSYLLRNCNESTLDPLLRWSIPIWSDKEREEFVDIMNKSWGIRQLQSLSARTKERYANSPGVVDLSYEDLIIIDSLDLDWRQFRNANKERLVEIRAKCEKIRKEGMSFWKNEKKVEAMKKNF